MKILLKLFSLKLIASLLGLAYSILQVKYFGASRVIEIYFAAQSLIYLVTSLTQSGQLAEIFLPEFHKLNEKEKGLGFYGLNVVINRVFIYGTVIIFVVFIFASVFINLLVPGFSEEDKNFAVLIFRTLLPYLYFQLANSFLITVLNAEQKFGRAELLGFTNSLVNILVLVFLYPYFGLWALVISLLLGKIIEFVFYSLQLYKIGFRYKLILSIPEFDHNSFFKTMRSTVSYVGATQVYSIVLTASISFLPEGTFAIFKYVQNLANKVKGLLIQPFLTIFFTRYSLLLQASKSTLNEFNKNFKSIINVNAITIIGSILLGDIIIKLIWGGKNFDSNDVSLAYLFLLFNISSILISSLSAVYRKMVVVHGEAKKLYFSWVFSQLLSAGFSYFLIKYFKINGLYFIIPINAVLLGIPSYFYYYRGQNAIKYSFFNRNNVIVIFLIIFSTLIKQYINFIPFLNEFIILIFTLIIFSIYPIMSIYRIFKD